MFIKTGQLNKQKCEHIRGKERKGEETDIYMCSGRASISTCTISNKFGMRRNIILLSVGMMF